MRLFRYSLPLRAGMILVALAGIAAPAIVSAAPAARLWPRWQAHDAASTRVIDHAAWTAFLRKYVRPDADGINRVAYGQVTAADRRALKAYIQRLGAMKVTGFNRKEQLAFWINLYNAVTVDLIVSRWPVRSIRDISISPGLFTKGPWGRKLLTVEGVKLSLDDIEHRILRPIWRDPRIHYAVNCASLGCPNLQPQAFTGANADALMTRGARQYVNHPRGVAINDGRLRVSSIYVWFRTDFGGTDAGVIRHLMRYAGPDLKAKLARIKGIADDGYDWAVNARR